jgi:two-component system response regulator YesN
LRKAIEYIHEHYNEQVSLNEVADSIYVSTFYISRMFKKELGKSFVDYLNDVKIEKAKELLKDIKYKTYEVADLVGISDPHYFSKLFKKHSGMTPSEYRETITIKKT